MKNTTAQSVIEYAILIGIVASALTAMNVYMKRGVQAGIKVAADKFGSQSGSNEVVDKDYSKPQHERMLFSNVKSSQDAENTINLDTYGRQTVIDKTVITKSESRTEVENMSDEE